MASIFKKMLGMAPKNDSNGSFSPSTVALKLATKSKTDYDHSVYPNAYQEGKLKVLMICTEERYMTMQNGTKFSTGNHPVEMLVPMLHLEKAGFDIDVCTPTGQPVKVEMWAMPSEDDAVQKMYKKYLPKFEKPQSLQSFVQDGMTEDSPYIAVFIPGGHGAMLGLPESRDLQKVISWVVDQDKYMLSICHGPAALLAANLDGEKDAFAYKGYKVAIFPDSVDKMTPLFGYMPGHMPWYFGEKLSALGVEIINKKADDACYQDRKLITGASPNAANAFGKMAAEALLDELA
ncbi:glyoxalase III HchA [Marinomonas sp.]|uniref:glyoxalase III HchA n=1 Tax=Marinomonas sp. TaxID=1904862 RepID=UPI003BA995C5